MAKTRKPITTKPAEPAEEAMHVLAPKPVHIRWGIRRDMPEVLAIEQAAFPFAWCEEDFVRLCRQRNVIMMIAECRELVVGYMVYELHKNRLHVLNFAVHPDHRRRGVGRAMLEKLKGKLGLGQRKRIMLEVRERNLDAQLFFKREGFRAISLLRDFYLQDSPDEDAYLMQYRHGQRAPAIASVSGPA